MGTKILPGTGRGTTRSVVVGALLQHHVRLIAPSTACSGSPLRAGED
ncbi:MAG: hypothetical protein JWQ16_3160 [Novosphingobium sp.]|nr:hypothetical protein [Novosphingobium sp.]